MKNQHNHFDEYYKYKNEPVTVFIRQYGKSITFRTDIFHIVFDKIKRSNFQNHRVVQAISDPYKFFEKYYKKHLSGKRIFYRINWEILLANSPNKFLITINKIGNLGHDRSGSRRIMTEFLKRLRQRLYGRNPKNYLEGYVIEELGYDGTYHYHILLADSRNTLTLSLQSLREVIGKTVYSLNKSARKSNHLTRKARYCVPEKCWDVQTFREDKLEHYLTKSLEKDVTFEENQSFGIIALPDDDNNQSVCFG